MIPVNDSLQSPFTLPEPSWVSDSQSHSCIQCQGKFDFMNRKHHCRRCGRCFCDKCCSNKLLLPRMLFIDPVRHCASCTNISKKENEFFEKHMKTLLSGGLFHVNQSSEATDNDLVYLCRLSSDHRLIQFECDKNNLDDILLGNIDSIQICSDGKDSEGNSISSGLAMKYKNGCGEIQVVKMVVTKGNSRQQGQAWVVSMQKAFHMIKEAKTALR